MAEVRDQRTLGVDYADDDDGLLSKLPGTGILATGKLSRLFLGMGALKMVLASSRPTLLVERTDNGSDGRKKRRPQKRGPGKGKTAGLARPAWSPLQVNPGSGCWRC